MASLAETVPVVIVGVGVALGVGVIFKVGVAGGVGIAVLVGQSFPITRFTPSVTVKSEISEPIPIAWVKDFA